MWKGVCQREHRFFSDLQVAQYGLSTGHVRTSDGWWGRKIIKATFTILRDLNFSLWNMGHTGEFQAGDWCDQNCTLEKLITLECWRPFWGWVRMETDKLVRNLSGRNKLRSNSPHNRLWVIQQGFFGGQREGIPLSRGVKFYSQTIPLEWLLLIKGSLDLHHAGQFGDAKVDWSCFLGGKLESWIFCVYQSEKNVEFLRVI